MHKGCWEDVKKILKDEASRWDCTQPCPVGFPLNRALRSKRIHPVVHVEKRFISLQFDGWSLDLFDDGTWTPVWG